MGVKIFPSLHSARGLFQSKGGEVGKVGEGLAGGMVFCLRLPVVAQVHSPNAFYVLLGNHSHGNLFSH